MTNFEHAAALQMECDKLRAELEAAQKEIASLKAQLTVVYNVLDADAEREHSRSVGRNIIYAALMRERDEAKAELEAARKVADAAIAWQAARDEYLRTHNIDSVLHGDVHETTQALNEAVSEYRARVESPPLEERIAKACEKLDELE